MIQYNYQCPVGMYDKDSGKCAIDSIRCMHSNADRSLQQLAERCCLALNLLTITGELITQHTSLQNRINQRLEA